MGYRLHAMKTSPSYGTGCFNHDYDRWGILFADKFSENGWMSEDETECEVKREDMEAYRDHLMTLTPTRKNHYFKEDDNAYVIAELNDLLSSTEDMYVRMDWF